MPHFGALCSYSVAVKNDRSFPVHCINPVHFSCYLKEVAWVATKKKVVCLPQSGCCTLSQTETSGKEKEGGNCSFPQGQAQLCRTFWMQSGKGSERNSMSTDWDIPERTKLLAYSMMRTQSWALKKTEQTTVPRNAEKTSGFMSTHKVTASC